MIDCQLIDYALKLEPVSMLSSRSAQEIALHREQRYARYCQVVKLHQQGVKQRDISRTTGISISAIRKYIRAGDFPERARTQPHSQLEPYILYLHQRWLEGCENATQLWHEVKIQGYPGKPKMVERYIRRLRQQKKTFTPEQQRQFLQAQTTFKLPSVRRAVWWLLKPLEKLTAVQQTFIKSAVDISPEVKIVQDLGQAFQKMIRQREMFALDDWLLLAQQSQVPEMKGNALGIIQDS